MWLATGSDVVITMSEIAIAHDQFSSRGGAERVACELARTFNAPIYAGWVDRSVVPDDVTVRQVFDSSAAGIARRLHYMAEDFYQMQAWQQCDELVDYDTVIINKNNAGWYVPQDDQTIVWYLHSTPRNLYDRFHDHERGLINKFLAAAMRTLYAPNTRYADAWVCNSELVERRLRRYWDIDDATVIHPPTAAADLEPDTSPTGESYVTIGRLERHKRTREIIEAANALRLPLKVGGDGSEREMLGEIAGPTVEVLGYVSEAEKERLLAEAKAFVFNAINEDFGMAPVEAMGAGTPVVGVRDGFTQFQVRDGENGVLFDRGDLVTALDRFERSGVAWGEEQISQWATQRFSRKRFRDRMRAVVAAAQDEAEITPSWDEPATDSEPVELTLTDGGADDE